MHPDADFVAAVPVADAGVAGELTAAVPDVPLRVVDFASTGDPGFITDNGRTTYALIQAPVPTTLGPYVEVELDPALAHAADGHGFEGGLTSYGLLSAGGRPLTDHRREACRPRASAAGSSRFRRAAGRR